MNDMGNQGKPDAGPIFVETQRFNQTWLWALVLIATGAAWLAFVCETYGSIRGEGERGEVGQALQLGLSGGERILFGSQRAEGLASALERIAGG